jgi:hypothetical protein
MKVKLIDGPYEGIEVDIGGGGGFYIGGQLPDGTEVPDRQAYYRPTRKRSEYRFKGWVGDEEIITLPLPGASS